MTHRFNNLLLTDAVLALNNHFGRAGFSLFLVGGPVRDTLLNKRVDDLDFTTWATPEEIEAILGKGGFATWDTGKSYGTISATIYGNKVEITTFRADTYEPDNRRPEVVWGTNIEDDLRRRDFTINAMALNVYTGELVDPFGGEQDLKKRVIRTPGNAVRSMTDDPLRIIRALRFSILLDAEIADELWIAIHMVVPKLDTISRERKTAELMKILAAGQEKAFRLINGSIPLWAIEQFIGVRFVCESTGSWKTFSPELFFARVGYTVCDSDFTVEEWLVPLKLPAVLIERVRKLIDVRRHLEWVLKTGDLHFHFEVSRLVRHNTDEFLDDLAAFLPKTNILTKVFYLRTYATKLRAPLAVNGDDLVAIGMKGPEIGKALRVIENFYLWGHHTNSKKTQLWIANAIHIEESETVVDWAKTRG